ncbi:MAG: M20/M25/M40 family metallo-hydrolase, partial [Solirubrobacterales bacterium]
MLTDAAEPSTAGTRAIDLLSRLIRFDTTNPPGNEEAAQRMLRAELDAAGFECELLAAVEGRPNLIARLRGAESGPNLCLLSHVDVVPAEAEDWSFDPFGGEVTGGEVRGRGAQDMKSQTAAEVAAACELASSGWRPARGDLLVIVTADEEMGATHGARWLCEAHPEKVACEWVVNEGAGIVLAGSSGPAYTVCIGEKGVFRFRVIAHGTAGHASIPRIGDNALLKLAPMIERLRTQPEPTPDADAHRFLEAVSGVDPRADLAAALDRLGELDPLARAVIAEPMLGVSVTPTRASASQKDNVIPAHAEILVDCRVPPGMKEPEVRATVESLLGEGEHEIDFTEHVVGNRSDPEGPLYDAIADWIGCQPGDASPAPMVMPGFSDSHWFRKELGATAFGFFP